MRSLIGEACLRLPSSPPKTLKAINLVLLQMMREIDEEALPVDGDYPTGLWWYVGHLDRDGAARKKNNTEFSWSSRLTELFNDRGWSAAPEHPYPTTKERCDCIVDLGFEKPWWIEVKGAWREAFDHDRPNTVFMKHLYATAHDVSKLCTLTSKDASGVSLIVVGFDRPHLPITRKDLGLVCAAMRPRWAHALQEWMWSDDCRLEHASGCGRAGLLPGSSVDHVSLVDVVDVQEALEQLCCAYGNRCIPRARGLSFRRACDSR
jgi:hypothetical protein